MPLLQALTLAQLQIFENVMRELLANGVVSLDAAKSLVRQEIAVQHKLHGNAPAPKETNCPHCGKKLLRYRVDNTLVTECRDCWWSTLEDKASHG